MTYIIEKRLSDLQPYRPNEGNFHVRLDANESFIPLPDRMKQRFAEIINEIDYRRYPDPYAADLCKAFAKVYGIESGDITVGNGSDELIGLIMETFLTDGGKALVFAPDFSMYGFYATLRRGSAVAYQKKDGLYIDADEVIKLVKKERPRVIIFSNPCNPTGQILNREEVKKIVCNSDALIVLDEAYMDFADQSLLPEYRDFDNLIILKTMSKAYAAAALRIGFAIANPTLTKVLKAAKSPYNVNSLTQRAAEEALKDTAFIQSSIQAILASKKSLYGSLKELKSVCGADFTPVESATNFILCKSAAADKIYRRLAEDGIAVRLIGSAALRITAGSEEENNILINTLRSYKE